MSLENLTNKVKELAASKGGSIKSKIKFQFDEGFIFLDDTVSPAVVSNDDLNADCVVKVSISNFEKLMSGDLNPTGAFMMGKLKVDGDMGVAMKLSSLF